MMKWQSAWKTGVWRRAAGLLRRREVARQAYLSVQRQSCQVPYDVERLERIAACARGGYFDINYAASMFVFIPEIPF